LAKISIFGQNLYFLPKFLFLSKILLFDQNVDFLPKISILSKNSIFYQNFYFWPEFGFLIKIWIFDQNLDFFRQNFTFLMKIWFFLKKISHIDHNSNFDHNFLAYILRRRFIFCNLETYNVCYNVCYKNTLGRPNPLRLGNSVYPKNRNLQFFEQKKILIHKFFKKN